TYHSKLKKEIFLFVINTPERLIQKYSREENVQLFNPAAQTISITYKDYNAALAADLSNVTLNEYNLYDQERKTAGADRSIEFINSTLKSVEDELKESELSLEVFKKSNKVLDPAQNASSDLGHINSLIDQKVLVQLDLKILDRLERDINEKKDF